MSKSNPSLQISIADYVMEPSASPKASSSSIIWPSLGFTILSTQNRFTILGTILQSLRNYLEATTLSINPFYPKTPPTKQVFI